MHPVAKFVFVVIKNMLSPEEQHIHVMGSCPFKILVTNNISSGYVIICPEATQLPQNARFLIA